MLLLHIAFSEEDVSRLKSTKKNRTQANQCVKIYTVRTRRNIA